MPIKNGTINVKEIGPGEAHLQHEIIEPDRCYFCHREKDLDMVLIRVGKKRMAFACLTHHGILQDFIREYNFIQLGYIRVQGDEKSALGNTVGKNTKETNNI